MATALPSKTVLVVEDDDITRTGFGMVLSDHGYPVALAADGQEALDYLRDHPAPDLILLDMLTPGLDGWQFLKHHHSRWASIPVLITTALSIASDEWAISLGAVGLLHKPIDLGYLLQMVEGCLRQDHGAQVATGPHGTSFAH